MKTKPKRVFLTCLAETGNAVFSTEELKKQRHSPRNDVKLYEIFHHSCETEAFGYRATMTSRYLIQISYTNVLR